MFGDLAFRPDTLIKFQKYVTVTYFLIRDIPLPQDELGTNI